MSADSQQEGSDPQRGEASQGRTETQGQNEADDARPPVALPEGTQLREEYRVGAVLGAVSLTDALFLNPPIDGWQ